MNRKEFGRLVQALRREHKDDQDNCWTQKDLARAAGLLTREALAETAGPSKASGSETGAAIIGKIERGERAMLDEDMLLRLADALELTSMERREFFLAASGVDSQHVARKNSKPGASLDDLLHMMEGLQLPAFIDDCYSDLVATNDSIRAFLGIGTDFVANAMRHPIGTNVMHLIFSPESGFRGTVSTQWDDVATRNMQFFRKTTLRYRSTPYFVHLHNELRKNRMYRKFWAEAHLDENDNYAEIEFYDYRHPVFGAVRYLATISSTVTRHGELFFTCYVPTNPHTAQVFADLAKDAGTGVHRWGDWPKKRPP